MDSHYELIQDVILVTTAGNPGIHDYALQAGVNEVVLTDPLSGTTTYQYGTVGGAFQNLANWWVTYSIVSVQVTVQLYNITTGVINSPFLAATEAAELDTQVPQTYQEFAATGRLTISNSLTGSISRSQNYQKYLKDNLPRPYLNTMSSNATTRETYVTTYAATPVIQIAWQSQVSSYGPDFEIPKFIAIVSTNTKYHFRGRRTTYPGITVSASLLSPPISQEEETKVECSLPRQPDISQSQLEIATLKRKIAVLQAVGESMSSAKLH